MLRMTDSPDMPPPAINASFAKGIALGLGVLLLGGTALLITLLVTRDPSPSVVEFPPIELQVGEKITAASHFEGQGLFVIEGERAQQRVLLLNFTTGERTEIKVLAQPNRSVTE